MKFDLNKSLQDLENSDWGEPKSDSSLENKCLQLRRVPLMDLKGSDLLRLISQDIGIEYLIPLAIELLRVDPLADRDVYPGSLLGALLEASYKYWDKNPNLREEVEKMYNKILINEKNDEDIRKDVVRELKKSHLTFAEFGRYASLLWDNIQVKQTCNSCAVKILAVIASKQSIILEDLTSLISFPISEKMIEFLLKNKFITYDYEGSYPADRFFRLSKDFREQLGLTRRKKG
ncbi:contact-dependent growth inhibition system immunity protein [Criblamydia sequanensis]|uniref:Uncharacterized protein n=1 Tax=Candidatus Criblamydia sequanensis CRIB-18 TaxID=1437425 RepID=A0A090D153_9BACT|nr:contact-dependent growth inhibition system immunity protein [Criblamydia sequanensis]CDR33635.1 hypothetical protein CSEC_0806 [Criblamydia sequanensis CRIB-18]